MSIASLQLALRGAARGLVEREALVELVGLAAVAGEHLLLVGPPGTGKSEAARRVARALGGSYFEYLLGRFTEPSEIFGPVDLRRLKEGVVETQTQGMLPEAEFAFLDEVFLGSTAILNTLLSLLNERTFRRGATRMQCPLRLCVGASNALPEDESLAAFADRFLLRFFVDSIPDQHLEDLLESGWALQQEETAPTATVQDLDALAQAARAADLSGVRSALAHAVRLLRSNGIVLSDRRTVRAQRVIAAAAVLSGRSVATEADLWPLLYVVPTAEQQRTARDVLRDLLDRTQNPALPAAAEHASASPAVRASRLLETARAILTQRPETGSDRPLQTWRLKVEGVAREIDASLAPSQLPDELRELRSRLVEAAKVGPGLS